MLICVRKGLTVNRFLIVMGFILPNEGAWFVGIPGPKLEVELAKDKKYIYKCDIQLHGFTSLRSLAV